MTTLLLTTEEAASYLGTGLAFVQERVRCGDIPHIKVGRYIKVHRQALEEWARAAADNRATFA